MEIFLERIMVLGANKNANSNSLISCRASAKQVFLDVGLLLISIRLGPIDACQILAAAAGTSR